MGKHFDCCFFVLPVSTSTDGEFTLRESLEYATGRQSDLNLQAAFEGARLMGKWGQRCG